MSLGRRFFCTVIVTCVIVAIAGSIVLATLINPAAWRSVMYGPWGQDGTRFSTNRDDDGVRIQMRRAYRVSGLDAAGVSNLQIINRHTGDMLVTMPSPSGTIYFGKPALRDEHTTPWLDVGDVHRDTRLRLMIECDDDPLTLPTIETRIKPGTWSRWVRWR